MDQSAAIGAGGEVVFLPAGLAVNENALPRPDIGTVLLSGDAVCEFCQGIEVFLLVFPGVPTRLE